MPDKSEDESRSRKIRLKDAPAAGGIFPEADLKDSIIGV